ncbi:hypothetical protein [Nocardia sp. NPDC051570]|uniref:hypothetical protein n=1 Tax=Nocardia sp. NPDC051570 TaxID=3364324 RepID=UPI0037AB4F67
MTGVCGGQGHRAAPTPANLWDGLSLYVNDWRRTVAGGKTNSGVSIWWKTNSQRTRRELGSTMELATVAAITTGITVVSAAAAKVAICIYALKGVPLRDRSEVIRALARLLCGDDRSQRRRTRRARDSDPARGRSDARNQGRPAIIRTARSGR